MPNPNLALCLSSDCFTSYLFPRLTIFELLRFTQISQECRHGLQHEKPWHSALKRSLPAAHPLRSPDTGFKAAALQYGNLQSMITQSGGEPATLNSADLGPYKIQDVCVSSGELFAVCRAPAKVATSHGTHLSWETNLFTMLGDQGALQALCPFPPPAVGALHRFSPNGQHVVFQWHVPVHAGGVCLNLACLGLDGTAAVCDETLQGSFWRLRVDTPLAWSPCSTMMSVSLFGESKVAHRLFVLNTALEVLLAWPDADRQIACTVGVDPFSQDIVHTWTPGSTLIAVVQPSGRKAADPLEVLCWNPVHDLAPSELQAAQQAKRQLQDIGEGERFVCLVWGVHGLAAVTKLCSADGSGMLYLWLPGKAREQMGLCGDFLAPSEPCVQWSPAGDRLLLTCQGVQLISTSCTLLLQLPGELQGRAWFSPCGRYLCVADQISQGLDAVQMWGLILYRSLNGEKVFCKALPGLRYCYRLTISDAGDKAIMVDEDAVYVVQFGQVSGSCTGHELCRAVTAACRLISA